MKQDLSIKHFKIKKDDLVSVLLGKDNGKTGKVLNVNTKEGRVSVEGINMFKRHVRKTQGIEGGILEIAKPVDISNLAVVCPKCKKATRVGFKMEGDMKVRFCKKCKEII